LALPILESHQGYLPEQVEYDVEIFEELVKMVEASEGGGTTTGFPFAVAGTNAEGGLWNLWNHDTVFNSDLQASAAAVSSGLFVEDGALNAQSGDDTCKYHFDGVCDEPEYCSVGTDHSDCRGNFVLNDDGQMVQKTLTNIPSGDLLGKAEAGVPLGEDIPASKALRPEEQHMANFSNSSGRGDFLQNYVINIGSAHLGTTKVLAPVIGLVCPEFVNRHNRIHIGTGGMHESFKVEVVGNRITVTRTDADAGWNMNLAFNCFEGFPYNYYRKVHGVGHWGGTCKCPNGRTYQVGDTMYCTVLTMHCTHYALYSLCTVLTKHYSYQVGDTMYCTVLTMHCTHYALYSLCTVLAMHSSYQVGDNGDSCESLACEGGISGECGEGLIESSAHGMKVSGLQV
jgi:hypothetical protein